MEDDQRLATLLGQCIGELDARGDAGQPRALELLRQVEEISPGLIAQMHASLQLARLSRITAH
mgnify:CR=1 FL=1